MLFTKYTDMIGYFLWNAEEMKLFEMTNIKNKGIIN